jgi:hypothetical protein
MTSRRFSTLKLFPCSGDIYLGRARYGTELIVFSFAYVIVLRECTDPGGT